MDNTYTCEKCGAESPEHDLRYFRLLCTRSGNYEHRQLTGVRRLRICEKCIQTQRKKYSLRAFLCLLPAGFVFGTALIEILVSGRNFGAHIGKSALFGIVIAILAGCCAWFFNRKKSAAFLGRSILDDLLKQSINGGKHSYYASADRNEYISKSNKFDDTILEKSIISPLVLAGVGNDVVDMALEKYHGVNANEADVNEQKILALSTQKTVSLFVYFDIGRLGDGAYGLAAGRAIGKAVPVSMMEGMEISSGDSKATIHGSANEYVVCLSGNPELIASVKEKLDTDPEVKHLLSSSGINMNDAKEPLVSDGTVKNGELIIPDGTSASFCAAGIRDAWNN